MRYKGLKSLYIDLYLFNKTEFLDELTIAATLNRSHYDRQMVKNIIKGILILCGIGLVIFIGYIGMIISAFGGFDKDYSLIELKENFEKIKQRFMN